MDYPKSLPLAQQKIISLGQHLSFRCYTLPMKEGFCGFCCSPFHSLTLINYHTTVWASLPSPFIWKTFLPGRHRWCILFQESKYKISSMLLWARPTNYNLLLISKHIDYSEFCRHLQFHTGKHEWYTEILHYALRFFLMDKLVVQNTLLKWRRGRCVKHPLLKVSGWGDQAQDVPERCHGKTTESQRVELLMVSSFSSPRGPTEPATSPTWL